MLAIIFGAPGAGKTSFLAYLLNESAFDYESNQLARYFWREKVESLGARIQTPQHFTYFNGEMTFKKAGYTPRKNYMLYPERLGIQKNAPEGVICQYINRGSTLGITEAHKYWASRNGQSTITSYQFTFFLEHRHNDLTIYLDSQRPMMIDKNIRDISIGYSIVKRRNKGHTVEWDIDVIQESFIEAYLNAKSKKEKRELSTRQKFVCPYDIYEIYDSQGCSSDFTEGYSAEQLEEVSVWSE